MTGVSGDFRLYNAGYYQRQGSVSEDEKMRRKETRLGTARLCLEGLLPVV